MIDMASTREIPNIEDGRQNASFINDYILWLQQVTSISRNEERLCPVFGCTISVVVMCSEMWGVKWVQICLTGSFLASGLFFSKPLTLSGLFVWPDALSVLCLKQGVEIRNFDCNL